jgi:hypothetical protein
VTIRELRVEGVDVSLAGDNVTGRNSTVVRIVLEAPIQPGDSVRITVGWDYEVPLDESGASLRQGRWGTSVFQMGQWYPRLAMYDDLGGWDVAEHDGSMEFFNPFASFRVSLELPIGWLAGATGRLENGDEVLSATTRRRLLNARHSDTAVMVVGPDEVGLGTAVGSGEYVEWTFAADSVNDFAWGASPEYMWISTSREHPSGERVLVHALATSRHYGALVNAAERAADALSELAAIVGAYPWAEHWLIDGPEGGMEYPAVTMSHGDGRTLHEMVHQWFPMTVGSDETRFNFMDEGLASFLPLTLQPGPLGVLSDEREALVPILLPNDLRTVRPVLGYGRGSRMLAALAAEFGDQPVLDALRLYSTAWRFKHPSPWDFMALFEGSIGTEMDAFWIRWLFQKDAIRR